jgi:hypothetical protein
MVVRTARGAWTSVGRAVVPGVALEVGLEVGDATEVTVPPAERVVTRLRK